MNNPCIRNGEDARGGTDPLQPKCLQKRSSSDKLDAFINPDIVNRSYGEIIPCDVNTWQANAQECEICGARLACHAKCRKIGMCWIADGVTESESTEYISL